MFKHAPWFFENSVFVRDSSIQAPTCLRTVHVSFQLLVAFGRTNLRGIFVYICIYMIVYIYLYYIASYRCFPANILALKKTSRQSTVFSTFFMIVIVVDPYSMSPSETGIPLVHCHFFSIGMCQELTVLLAHQRLRSRSMWRVGLDVDCYK